MILHGHDCIKLTLEVFLEYSGGWRASITLFVGHWRIRPILGQILHARVAIDSTSSLPEGLIHGNLFAQIVYWYTQNGGHFFRLSNCGILVGIDLCQSPKPFPILAIATIRDSTFYLNSSGAFFELVFALI